MPHDTQVDFGLRSGDYARHRPGFPSSFFDRLRRIFPIRGAPALDLGTGPGSVALELARRGARVIGVDLSPNQVIVARRTAVQHGLVAYANFAAARAEQIPLPDDSVALVTAGQCWTWFDHRAALSEIQRVLRPGGYLVVAHNCYLSIHSLIAAESERLILKLNPGWTMAGQSGLYPQHVDALQNEAIRLVEQFCYDYDQPFTHESWRGRMRTCNGIGAGGMSEQDVARYDAELKAWLAKEFPQEPISIQHRVWAVVCRKHE